MSVNVAKVIVRLKRIRDEREKLMAEQKRLSAVSQKLAARVRFARTGVERVRYNRLLVQTNSEIAKNSTKLRSLNMMETSLSRRLSEAKVATAKAPSRLSSPGLPAQQASGLTPEQLAEVKQVIAELQARGVSEDQAEEQAKARVLPPHLVRAYPPGYFRGVRRAGPRPVPYTAPVYRPVPGEFAPAVSIDPMPRGRGIDPRPPGMPVDPIVAARPIDPFVRGVTLPTVGGAFTFPPGNIADAAKMTVDAAKAEEDGEKDTEALDGVTEGGGELPWAWIAGGAAALFLLPKLLGKKGKGGEPRTNPRHRRHRKNRRAHRRSRR